MDYKISQMRLLVSNFKACFLFYRDVMGFKVTYGDEYDVYASFDIGDATLALYSRLYMSEAIGTSQLPAAATAQDRLCLCFVVENVDAACQQLQKQGVSLITEPMDRTGWGVRTAHFRDPDGNLLEVNQELQV